MRVVAGEYRSRRLKTLTGNNTRPTLDKVKEAIFSSIGPYFDHGTMLDLFSGSGAMGIEGLSRGIDFCYFNDSNEHAYRVILENIKLLKIDNAKIWKLDYRKVLKMIANQNIKLDLIFLDPPYALDVIPSILEFISTHDLLNEKGIIVCETEKNTILPDSFKNFVKRKTVVYGICQVTYYYYQKEGSN